MSDYPARLTFTHLETGDYLAAPTDSVVQFRAVITRVNDGWHAITATDGYVLESNTSLTLAVARAWAQQVYATTESAARGVSA